MFEALPEPSPRTGSVPLVLLHSGSCPHERDPTALFDALALLRDRGLATPGEFVIRFRTAVNDDLSSMHAWLESYGAAFDAKWMLFWSGERCVGGLLWQGRRAFAGPFPSPAHSGQHGGGRCEGVEACSLALRRLQGAAS